MMLYLAAGLTGLVFLGALLFFLARGAERRAHDRRGPGGSAAAAGLASDAAYTGYGSAASGGDLGGHSGGSCDAGGHIGGDGGGCH